MTAEEIPAVMDAVLSRIAAIEYVIENNADYNAQKSVSALCEEIRRILRNFARDVRIKESAPVRRLESGDGKYAIICYSDEQVCRAREKILCALK